MGWVVDVLSLVCVDWAGNSQCGLFCWAVRGDLNDVRASTLFLCLNGYTGGAALIGGVALPCFFYSSTPSPVTVVGHYTFLLRVPLACLPPFTHPLPTLPQHLPPVQNICVLALY